ncbi:hypothetical protein EJ06DRAFT_584815 [Trichodelitschia bisporula]|uniref:Uncharacterized protein n=1 Tax=Trichodelitschia bisporula TaxID=703511 RepID=A0A6G1HLN1_9PEZI|nr:hypothetical protein EJ06DRAFT_584815 [Trichodelitschia bisporula]
MCIKQELNGGISLLANWFRDNELVWAAGSLTLDGEGKWPTRKPKNKAPTFKPKKKAPTKKTKEIERPLVTKKPSEKVISIRDVSPPRSIVKRPVRLCNTCVTNSDLLRAIDRRLTRAPQLKHPMFGAWYERVHWREFYNQWCPPMELDIPGFADLDEHGCLPMEVDRPEFADLDQYGCLCMELDRPGYADLNEYGCLPMEVDHPVLASLDDYGCEPMELWEAAPLEGSSCTPVESAAYKAASAKLDRMAPTKRVRFADMIRTEVISTTEPVAAPPMEPVVALTMEPMVAPTMPTWGAVDAYNSQTSPTMAFPTRGSGFAQEQLNAKLAAIWWDIATEEIESEIKDLKAKGSSNWFPLKMLQDKLKTIKDNHSLANAELAMTRLTVNEKDEVELPKIVASLITVEDRTRETRAQILYEEALAQSRSLTSERALSRKAAQGRNVKICMALQKYETEIRLLREEIEMGACMDGLRWTR